MSLKYFALFICFLLCNVSSSQTFDPSKSNLKINVPASDNRSAARDLHQVLNTGLKKDFNVHAQSLFSVSPYVTIGDSKLIEGMETYTYTEVEIEFIIGNKINKETKKWNYKGRGKGRNSYSAVSDAMKKFRSDKKGLKEFSKVIAEYIDKELNGNCSAFLAEAKAALELENIDQALLIISNIKEDDSCRSAIQILEKRIMEKQAQDVCEQQMQKIKIMVNSKQPLQLNRAVQYLLMIPPNAPCADEALQLSKKIGEHIDQQSGKTYELLVRYQNILHDGLSGDWFDYFLNNKLGK